MRRLLKITVLLVTLTMVSYMEINADANYSVNLVHNSKAVKELKVDHWEKVEFDMFSRDVWFKLVPKITGSYMINTYGVHLLQGELYDSTKENRLDSSITKDNDISLARTLINDTIYYVHITFESKMLIWGTCYVSMKYINNPNDELFLDQWGLMNLKNGLDINILPVWEQIRKSYNSTVCIGIADTGVYKQHTDLRNKINKEKSFNFVHNSIEIYPENEKYSALAAKGGHGTAVSGIIGAETENSIGIAGICPNASLIHMKVLGKKIENMPYNGSVAAFVQAVKYAQENNIKIVNCSFGGVTPSAAELDAMEKADHILFVIAAGNKGNDLSIVPEYPACYYLKNSLVVSSVNRDGEISAFSNYGGPCSIAAPGESIMTTFPEDIFDTSSGTSMSAPFVTGVAGVILLKLVENKKIEDIVKESKYNIKILDYFENIDAYVLECDNIEVCEAAIKRLNCLNNVLYAEMNYLRD